jgi:DNA-binding MarR family transcriptional regulator
VSSNRPDAHLGFLLKHVQLRYFELTAAALAPLGVNGREAAVLRAIDGTSELSQGEIASRMGVDRTTMVAHIDDLQNKGLVRRTQDPQDRRRNVVELTAAGRDIVHRVADVAAQAERTFLRRLSAADAEQFRKTLRILLEDA